MALLIALNPKIDEPNLIPKHDHWLDNDPPEIDLSGVQAVIDI